MAGNSVKESTKTKKKTKKSVKDAGSKKRAGSSRKSSQRSSSKSSNVTSSSAASNSRSRRSKSSLNSSTRTKKKQDLETFKTIYKASENVPKNDEDSPDLVISIVSWFQGAISVYLIAAIVYQLIRGWTVGIWLVQAEILFGETFAFLLLLNVAKRPYIGSSCTFLTIQFFLLFSLFSFFLQTPYDSREPFLDRMFGLAAVCLMTSGLHFFIIVQSMHLIKVSVQRKDYSEKVIVEGVEKRRKDLYLMINDLITEICYDDKDVKVNLTIKDETGRPKSMRGAGVEAGVTRLLEMSTDGQNVNLSTSNTTLACINVPKHKHHHSHHSHHKKHSHKNHNEEHAAPMIDSKYNNVSKQEKMLSPRKILK